MNITIARLATFLKGHRREFLLAGAGFLVIAFVVTYVRLGRLVDQRLREGVFASTIGIYAAPKSIAKGNPATLEGLASALRRAGYSEKADAGAIGQFQASKDVVTVVPGPASYVHAPPARILLEKGKIASITDNATGRQLRRYDLDPQLLSNLSSSIRARRRLIRYDQMPKVLINALLAAEDRNFFNHSGFDGPRIIKAAWVNLMDRRRGQGGSTLTMQLARNLWLTPQKTWRRKVTELLIALILEEKLTKQQILEHYANQAYLGNHDSYEIHGFGEAAWRYFNRDVGQLTLTEAALLAGMIQRPNYFDPQRHPDRARERRNLVLTLMRRNDAITQEEVDRALAAPLDVNTRSLDRSEGPYFIDLALNQAQQVASASPGSVKLYTTLDVELQSHAAEAVRIGMERLDKLVARKEGHRPPLPQVALIALDAQTGEVKAAIGGRNYGESQLNRVLTKRQPGSAFKPFVYASALESQLGGRSKVFTGATVLDDMPTPFKFGGEVYEPGNFGDTFRGPVLLRRALTSSLNVPTVALAQAVGYKRVVDLARRAGLKNVRATPALALGAYDASLLEVAGSYTVFANEGKYIEPTFLAAIQSADGKELYRHKLQKRDALDPRINWMIVDMLQDVLRYGTGASVLSYGLRAPVAGKTGTSRDGWFAGFTPELICVVWTGYDDNRDLELEGAKSALPVWAEFIKRATTSRDPSKSFADPPEELVSAEIDTETGELASSLSQKTRKEFFLAGYEPKTETSAESLEAIRFRKEEELPALLEARALEELETITKGGGQVGTANWYRPKSGGEMVAASPVLASGVKVKVTNVATGRSVVVTIAGQIPVESGYVISLAQSAASELDFVRSGFAQVRVEPVSR